MINEYNEIRNNPYQYILDWSDEILISTGKQSFKYLALMPHSLNMPEIPLSSTSIRSNINNFLIGNPGVGKSTIMKKFASFCTRPLIRRTISEADLIATASELKWFELIIEDLSQTADEGYSVIKAIEGIIGEEKSVNKSNRRVQYLDEVKAVALLGVTPMDLEKFAHELESGLLSRCTVVLLKLTRDDHQRMAEFTNLRTGDNIFKEKVQKTENNIINLYKELEHIQRNKHNEFLVKLLGENHNQKIINPIKGYQIDSKFKIELLNKWNKIVDNMIKNGQQPNIRDMHEYYRFLVSSAMLNIHKRKHDDGILVPNEQDHKIALDLTVENMRWKWAIPIALNNNRRARTMQLLEEILNNGVPEAVREVMLNISPFSHKMDKIN